MAFGDRSAASLREKIAASTCDARAFVSALFDGGTFLETGTYVKGSSSDAEFEGVVTGCGAVDGRLVFAFVQDYANGRGAFTASHAAKIRALYDKALRAGAPVVGVYASAGARLGEGVDAVAGYGEVMSKIAEAKSRIPQIAVIAGACGGAAAAAASMADFLLADKEKGELYVLPESDETMKKGVRADLYASGAEALAAKTKELLSFLPANSEEGTVCGEVSPDINVPSSEVEGLVLTDSDVRELIASLADGKNFFEVTSDKAPELVTGFLTVNGRAVGVVANQPTVLEGALTAGAAKKAARFVDFLGRFGIPVLTLVNTVGYGGENCGCYPAALASLAAAYASCASAKVTAVVGKAYGSAFTLLGSKRLGADTVFALDSSVISVLPPESAVEFVWDERLRKASDPAAARASLKEEWLATAASPLSAARSGDVDDIVAYEELKQRIAAALEIVG